MSYNNVEIVVDDETKSLRFGETLTSGSVYNVIVKDGNKSVGEGSIILMINETVDRRPIVVASCDLKHNSRDGDDDVSGTLSLSTEQLAEIAIRRPGVRISVYAVIHSNTNSQNVADGTASVKLVPVETNPSSGAAVLFKGPKGDAGRGISSISDGGTDESGNRIAVFGLSDGSSYSLSIPKGEMGLPAKMTAAYNAETNKWYQVQLVKDSSSNGYVLCVDSSGVDLSELPAADASASEAYGYSQTALGARDVAVDAKVAAVSAKTDAVTAAEQAQGYAAQASTAGSSAGSVSGSEAGRTAAQAVIDENLETIEGYASSASDSASSASESAESAANSASAAESIEEQVLYAVSLAESAANAASQAAESLDAPKIVYLDVDQEISSAKTFTQSPIVPDFGFEGNPSSESASVNYVDSKVDAAVSSIFKHVPISNTTISLSTNTARIINGDAGLDEIVLIVLVKLAPSPTGPLTIKYPEDSKFSDVDFAGGNVVIVKKSSNSSGELCRLMTANTTDYRIYRLAYLSVNLPLENGGES